MHKSSYHQVSDTNRVLEVSDRLIAAVHRCSPTIDVRPVREAMQCMVAVR